MQMKNMEEVRSHLDKMMVVIKEYDDFFGIIDKNEEELEKRKAGIFLWKKTEFVSTIDEYVEEIRTAIEDGKSIDERVVKYIKSWVKFNLGIVLEV